jgi:hypothetical protein
MEVPILIKESNKALFPLGNFAKLRHDVRFLDQKTLVDKA